MFEAANVEQLRANASSIFRDDMLDTHINELAQLFDGEISFSSTTVNYTISGKRLDIQLRGTVMPGFEDTLGRLLLTTGPIKYRRPSSHQATAQSVRGHGELFAQVVTVLK